MSKHIVQNHRKFQKAFREFQDKWIYPDAQAREADGKRPAQEVLDEMAYVLTLIFLDHLLTCVSLQ
jgi:hypothetical protein